MRGLIDTHVFIWYVQNSEKLTTSVTGLINDGKNQILLSTASIWEMAIKQSVGKLNLGVTITVPKTVTTPKITVGFTRPLIIPKDIAPNQPITVIIRGVGTVKNDVLSTTVPANFTGDLCFKASGTIFKPQGSKCN